MSGRLGRFAGLARVDDDAPDWPAPDGPAVGGAAASALELVPVLGACV